MVQTALDRISARTRTRYHLDARYRAEDFVHQAEVQELCAKLTLAEFRANTEISELREENGSLLYRVTRLQEQLNGYARAAAEQGFADVDAALRYLKEESDRSTSL